MARSFGSRNPGVYAALSCSSFGLRPRPPRWPLPFLRITFGSEDQRSTPRTNVVEVHAIIYPSPELIASILPTRHHLAARPSGACFPHPSWTPKRLPDLVLRHAVSQVAPAGARVWGAEAAQKKSKQATNDNACDESPLELRCAHLVKSGGTLVDLCRHHYLSNWRALLMPASIYPSLRSFLTSGLRLLSEPHALCGILTLTGKPFCDGQNPERRLRSGVDVL